eukprot:CAMPEP_0113424942 /NCGR_PEP_ID=MMETSP0013_2-20120614/29877_1 /TAXON_ID=2843 ORGANISM="Skeletonema costatum, Strain 1716" /NCGR_SAMPLE_ID=MMETSP0013_2 /ASSEMBLY_ACC=CAM_ASM_000158 /LENGTH=55 /DNA_ID=CAMNT_0000313015 /DNA_START=220 /DNA_END=387 /DNA_ORIENTATION=+ /assembly_acc=CAM_ASM_000158
MPPPSITGGLIIGPTDIPPPIPGPTDIPPPSVRAPLITVMAPAPDVIDVAAIMRS